MRTIIYVILGTLGFAAFAYAAFVLRFSFWVGNHIQDGLDSVGDWINAHVEVQDAKDTAYEMDFFRKLVFHTFVKDTKDDVLNYLHKADFKFDGVEYIHETDFEVYLNEDDGSHFIVIEGPLVKTYRNFEYSSMVVLAYDTSQSLSEIDITNSLTQALAFLEDETSLPEGITRVTIEMGYDIKLMRMSVLSKLRGQSYNDISQLIDAAGFDMIQKPNRIHVFVRAVRSVDFVFVDGALSHIANNCAETCHGDTSQ